MSNNNSIFNFDDYYNEAETLSLLNIKKARLNKLVESNEINTTRNKFAMNSKVLYLKSDVKRLSEELPIIQEHYSVAQLAKKFHTTKQRIHYLIKVHNLPTVMLQSKLLSGKERIFITKDVAESLYELHKNVEESRFKFRSDDYYNDNFNIYLYQQLVDPNGLPYRVVKDNGIWGVMTTYELFIPFEEALTQYQLKPLSNSENLYKHFDHPQLFSLKFDVGNYESLYPTIDFLHHYVGPNNVKLKTNGEYIQIKVTYEQFEVDSIKYKNVVETIKCCLMDGILNITNNRFEVLKLNNVCSSVIKNIPVQHFQLLNDFAAKQNISLDTLLANVVNDFVNGRIIDKERN